MTADQDREVDMAVKLGTPYKDVWYGTSGDDLAWGYGGDDELHGGGGLDYLHGGAGHDKLWGDGGADVLNGGAGSDELRGGSGDDALNGGDGTDLLVGGTGNDVLTGGAGSDTFLFTALEGARVDVIKDFMSGSDVLRLSGVTVSGGPVEADVSGDSKPDTVLQLSNGGTVILLGAVDVGWVVT